MRCYGMFFALRNLIYEISGGETVICNLHLKLSVLMGTMAAVGLSNVVCIETYHNTYHHYWLQYNLCKFMIREYICVSETAYKEMQLRFHTPKHKLCAIPNGVNRCGNSSPDGKHQRREIRNCQLCIRWTHEL